MNIVKVLIDADPIHRKKVRNYRPYLAIAEQALGRPLQGTELVHHIDGDNTNNSTSNLTVLPNQAYHMLVHARARAIEAGFNPDTHKRCSYHKTWEPKVDFANGGNSCREGTNARRRTTRLMI